MNETPPRFVRPTYNHTREDSAATPCSQCAALAYCLRLIAAMENMLRRYHDVELAISKLSPSDGNPDHDVFGWERADLLWRASELRK